MVVTNLVKRCGSIFEGAMDMHGFGINMFVLYEGGTIQPKVDDPTHSFERTFQTKWL